MQIISKNFHVQNIYKNLSCLDLSRFEACIKTRIFQYSKKEKSRLYHVFHFLERDNGRRHLSSTRFLSFRVLRAFVLFSILLPSSPSFFLEAWSLINLAPSPRNREFSHLRDRIVPWKKINCCASVSFNRLLLSSWSVACIGNRDFFFDENKSFFFK